MPNPFAQLMFNAVNSLAQRPKEPEYEMYKPTFQNQNRFAGLLDTMPQPTNPSIWRKIGASLSGLGQQDPYGTALGVANAPYFQQLNEWKMRAPFMQQAADNERQMNQVGMTANNQFRTQQINQQKADTAERAAEAKARTAEVDSETRRIRALAYDFKTRNPNLKIEAIPGGFLVGIDPLNGKTVPILDEMGAPIESGKMSESAKIAAQGINQMNIVNAQQAGANSRNAATIQGAADRNAATIAGAENRDTNNWITFQGPDGKTYRYNPASNITEETPLPANVNRIGVPGRTSSAGTSPAAQATTRKLRAQDIINANPSLQQYISPTGTVTEVKTGGIFGGATPFDEAFRQKMVDYIEGKTTEVPKLGVSTTPIRNTPGLPDVSRGTVDARTQVMRKTQRNTSTGATRTMISTDGGKTWRPE